MKTVVFSLLALLLFAFPAQALVQTGTSVPAVSLPDTDMTPHALPELMQGKVAMVVYWSLTCPHCHQAMPHFLFMNKRLTGNNFIMIFVNSDGVYMAEATANYAREQKMPAPWLIDEGADDSMPLAQALDVVATPSVFVFDVDGKLIEAQEADSVDIDKLMEIIQKAF